MVITESTTFKSGIYTLETPDPAQYDSVADTKGLQAALYIKGNNLEIDFSNSTLSSGSVLTRPDQFAGICIKVEGRDITIRNLNVRGFKIALFAEDSDVLRLENCDFSYNYRPRLYSGREQEDFADWLSYHNNEHNEWMRYGAGVYLKSCDMVTVKACTITGNQNALLMVGCENGLVYNNRFQFNSGLGVGLYRSSGNRIMHNFLDWNVRGYSHMFYERGQDSAGILIYEQSNKNTIAFNSATHSGDGLFLWAGQHTMDTGEGGCNDNLIFGNDFSHAPTNGIEVTFSRNTIQGNTIQECTYGIWGGYSYESIITGNAIINCKTGLAIEHGQQDSIFQNLFLGDSTGVRLWTRGEQPADWGYAQKRDTRNRDHLLDRNVFIDVRNPLRISDSEDLIANGENLFIRFEKLLKADKPNKGLVFWRNELYGTEASLEETWSHPELKEHKKLNFSHTGPPPQNPYYPLEVPVIELKEPTSLPDAQLTNLPQTQPKGRRFILVDEWGPYDFQRPYVYLSPEQKIKNAYLLELQGPAGSWELEEMEGVASANQMMGTFPATILVFKNPGAEQVSLRFKYNGPATITTVFGERILVDETHPHYFDFNRFEKQLDWQLSYFNYDANSDPLEAPDAFRALLKKEPVVKKSAEQLKFAWWGAPEPSLQADHFACVAETSFDIEPGNYALQLSSDDGIRVYLDGNQVLEHWDIHVPARDEVEVRLGGKHHLRIEYFEASGFATLGFDLKKLK